MMTMTVNVILTVCGHESWPNFEKIYGPQSILFTVRSSFRSDDIRAYMSS